MPKIVHDTDIGAGLEISVGKLNAASTMATDAEVAAAVQASETADNIEENKLLESVRLQDGLFHNTMWELQGNKVKAHTVDESVIRFISISSAGYETYAAFYFPAVGASVPSLSGGSPIVVDAQGFIELPNWGVLWYKYTGSGKGWYWSTFTGVDINPSAEYIRVLALNHDDLASNQVNAQLSNSRTIIQGKNYPDTGWIDLAPYFEAGVANFGGGHQPARFRRLNNRVYIEGLITCPAGYVGTLATLPAGFLPANGHLFMCLAPNSSRVDVNISGTLFQHTANGGWVSLDGINFGLE
jgi:hypothetical protein